MPARMLGRAGLDRAGARAPSLHRRNDDRAATGSAIPGAQGRLLFPGLASDYRRDDPRRARAARGDRRAALSRPGARLAARARRAITPTPDTGGYYPHRRRRRGPDRAAGARPATTPRPIPTRLIAQNLVRLAALTGDDRLWRDARRPAVRRPAAARGRAICSATRRCSTRSISACARPRSSSIGAGRTQPTSPPRALQAAVSRPHRAARADADALAGDPSGAGQDRGGAGKRRLRLRRRDVLAAGRPIRPQRCAASTCASDREALGSPSDSPGTDGRTAARAVRRRAQRYVFIDSKNSALFLVCAACRAGTRSRRSCPSA